MKIGDIINELSSFIIHNFFHSKTYALHRLVLVADKFTDDYSIFDDFYLFSISSFIRVKKFWEILKC
jgi:hypothetical protein